MYLALARKYRPQTFEDLIGQPHITKTLQNAIKMNKLYPSLIFSGMKGVGKTSAARVLAKALNCEEGPGIEPCNKCQLCKEITEDNSVDYIEIDGASNNGVDEVRNLREKVKYKPLKNRFRVVVIDEVHMLSQSAWNALLKTVEEPPEYTYFIMATTDFHKIPATIVSRCQHFEFKRIPYEIIIALLKDICKKEKIVISDYSLYLIARSSEGSLRDAKKVLDQSVALSSGDVQDNDVVAILGIIEEEIFIRLTRYVFTQNRVEIIHEINELSERGVDLRFLYNEYLKFFRDLMVLKSLVEHEKFCNFNPENIPEIKEIIKDVSDIELLRYFNAAKDLEITIKNTENPRIILEYLFIKLSYFPSLRSIEDAMKEIRSAGPMTNPSPEEHSSHQVPLPQPIADNPSARDNGSDALAANLTGQLEKEHPRLASATKNSSITRKNDQIVMAFSPDVEFAQKLIKKNSKTIQIALESILNQKIELKIVLNGDKKKTTEKKRVEDLKKDKKINDLVDEIKGKIISIENIDGGNNG